MCKVAQTPERCQHAQAEHRATTAEIQAATFRQDVLEIGYQLEKERKLSDRNLAIVAKDAEQKMVKKEPPKPALVESKKDGKVISMFDRRKKDPESS